MLENILQQVKLTARFRRTNSYVPLENLYFVFHRNSLVRRMKRFLTESGTKLLFVKNKKYMYI